MTGTAGVGVSGMDSVAFFKGNKMKKKDKIKEDLKSAMKSKDKIRLETVRSIRALILEHEKSGKEKELTPEQEIDYSIRIKRGDQVALEKLVKANLRFVVSVAKQYQNQGLSLGDLINEGNLGLIKAAKRFDETRGFKFISYAVWWIRQSILQALAEQARIVRLPLNKIGSINKIKF